MKVKKQPEHYLKKFLRLLSLRLLSYLQYLLESALNRVDKLCFRLSRTIINPAKISTRKSKRLQEKYVFLNRNPYKEYKNGAPINFDDIDIVQLYSFRKENEELIKDYKEWLWNTIEGNRKLLEEYKEEHKTNDKRRNKPHYR